MKDLVPQLLTLEATHQGAQQLTAGEPVDTVDTVGAQLRWNRWNEPLLDYVCQGDQSCFNFPGMNRDEFQWTLLQFVFCVEQ